MAIAAMRSLILTWIVIIFVGRNSSADVHNIGISTIFVAPALLPESPLASPLAALSPDINYLFPTMGGPTFSPVDSLLPTILSSPSAPNPDSLAAPSPSMASSSLGLPAFSGAAPASTKHQFPVMLACWVLQL